MPLLNYLGYEFSALMALMAGLCAGLFTIGPVRRTESGADPALAPRAVAGTAVATAAASALLVALPLVVMAANALFVRNCSIGEGMVFYLLLVPVSALFGSSLGFFSAVHSAHPRIFFLSVCALLLVYSLALGYFTPAIFSYNFLYGFFPGLTYDELLPLTRTLILFRLLTLFVSAVLLWAGMVTVTSGAGTPLTWRRLGTLAKGLASSGRRVRALAIACVLAGFYLFRCELGFESTSGFIRRTLGGEIRTSHFVLYYDPRSFTPVEIAQAAREHEFRLSRILAALSLPDHVFFESYIYPSPEVRARLIGASGTDITKPWSGQIHLSRQSLESSLAHELVHAAAAPLGLPVVRASLSTGLVEGLAMALGGEWGNRTLHEYAAAMHEAGIDPPIEEIMSFWGFARQQSSVSYILAGSFCRYLIDRYGIRKLALLYRSADYRAVYGRSLGELAGEWEGYLERVPLGEEDAECVDALFRRPPIFAKVCARVLARRSRDARHALASRQYAAAESLYAGVWTEGGGIEAFSGYLTSALRGGRFSVLTSALDTVVLADERPARFLPLFLSIGDALWASGDEAKAYALYDRVSRDDYSEGYTEAAALRLLAMESGPDTRVYIPLFLREEGDSVRTRMMDSLLSRDDANRLLAYLKARSLLKKGEFTEAVAMLRNLDMTSADTDLEALRLRYLGQALYRLGRYAEARSAFWISLNAADTPSDEEKVGTWIDRCEWADSHDE